MMRLRNARGIFLAAALALAMSALAAKRPAKKAESAATSTAPAPGSAAPKTDAAQQHFDSAQTYQLAGNFDSAAKEYRRAIAIGLDHLGNLRAAPQDYPAAGQLLRQDMAEDPEDAGPPVQ